MTDECKHADQNERNVAVVLRAKEDLVVQARILGNMQICWVCRNVALRCAPLMVVAHGILRQEYPMPAPLRRGDVRVKVKALGICGSGCAAQRGCALASSSPPSCLQVMFTTGPMDPLARSS